MLKVGKILFVCLFVGGISISPISLAGLSAQDSRISNPSQLYREGVAFYSYQQWDESIEAFRELIQRYPDAAESEEGIFFLGEALMQVESYSEAYRSYQRYLLRRSEGDLSARALFRMGEVAFRTGNQDSAIRLLELFIKQNPDHPMLEFALPYLAELRLDRVELQLAQRIYEQSLRQYPYGQLADRSRFGLARVLHQQGDWDEALRFYRVVLDSMDERFYGPALLYIGQIHLSRKDQQKAKEYFVASFKFLVDEDLIAEGHYWLARIHFDQQAPEEALKLLDQAVAMKSNPTLEGAILLDAAQIAASLGQYDLALDRLKVLKEKYPANPQTDAANWLTLDLLLRREEEQDWLDEVLAGFAQSESRHPARLGMFEKISRYFYDREDYRSADPWLARLMNYLGQNPEHDEAEANRWKFLNALCLLGKGKFEQAEDQLQRLDVLLLPDSVQPLFHLALARSRFGLKKFPAAVPGYQSFLGQFGGESATFDSETIRRARKELTLALAETQMWKPALQAFQQLKSEFGASEEVIEIAEYLADRANRGESFEKAAELYEFLLDQCSDPEKIPVFLSNLAWINQEQGSVQQAEKLFQRLVDEFPQHPLTASAALSLASAFEVSQQSDRALELYQKVTSQTSASEGSRLVQVARLRQAIILHRTGLTANLEIARQLLEGLLSTAGPTTGLDEARYLLGWVYLELGNQQEAEDCFNLLQQQFPESKYRDDVAIRLAQFRLKQGDFIRARAELLELNKNEEPSPAIRQQRDYLLGELALAENSWEELENLAVGLKQADRVEMVNRARYWLAESSFRQQKFERSLELFQELMNETDQNLIPGIDAELIAWLWLRGSQSAGKLEDWSRVETLTEIALQRFSEFQTSFEWRYLRGRALESRGLLSEARSFYQEVVDSPEGRRTETGATAQWRIGETYFHQENYSDAVKAYYLVDTLFSYEKWRSLALLQAGKCQENLGNFSQARRLYTRLMDQFPDSPVLAEARQRIGNLPAERITERTGSVPRN